MHGGPFANIAHGCNSVISTKTALKLADYVVTDFSKYAEVPFNQLAPDFFVPDVIEAPDSAKNS